MSIQNIKILVSKGETKKSLLLALETFENFNDIYNQIVVISSEYHRWEKDKRLGLTAQNSEINRINLAILLLTDQGEQFLKSAKISKKKLPKTKRQKKSKSVVEKSISKSQSKKQQLLMELIEGKEIKKHSSSIVGLVQNKIINNNFTENDTIETLLDKSNKEFFTEEIIPFNLKNVQKIFNMVGENIASPALNYFFKNAKIEIEIENDLLTIHVPSKLSQALIEKERFTIADEICRYTKEYLRVKFVIIKTDK